MIVMEKSRHFRFCQCTWSANTSSSFWNACQSSWSLEPASVLQRPMLPFWNWLRKLEKARKEKSFSIRVFQAFKHDAQPMKTSQAWSFIDVFLFEPRHTTPWTCLLRRKWTRKWWSRFLEVIFWQMRNDWESTSKWLRMHSQWHNFGIFFRLGLATGRWLRQYAFKLVTHPGRRVDFKLFSGGRMAQVSSHIISYR